MRNDLVLMVKDHVITRKEFIISLLREKNLVNTWKRSRYYVSIISLLRERTLLFRVIYLVITRKRSCYYEKSVCYNKIHSRYYLNFYNEKNAYIIRTF